MDCWYQENEKENSNKRNSNTQYLPSKCRTTRPPPPTPATNPLQFVKVAPPPLIQKAQEQVKKVEQVKSVRKDFKEDEEDWQQNLDNWKSSRRKRQEHIIERVVEVKKITQEEQDKGRRKSKTFNEILEERSKRGHRLKLPIYEDEDSDFTNYVRSSNSQSDVSKDEHEKAELSDKSNQNNDEDSEESQRKEHDNQLEKEKNVRKNYFHCNFDNITKSEKSVKDEINTFTSDQINSFNTKPKPVLPESFLDSKFINNNDNKLGKSNQEIINSSLDNMQQYTYESAIEGYRSRIKSKIKIDESIFNKPSEYKPTTKVDVPIPKGVLFKRKEIFEVEKPIAIGHLESLTSKRLSEDFANSQSIKERLKSLEKCTEQSLTRNIERDSAGIKWNSQSNDENDNKTSKPDNVTQSFEEENFKTNQPRIKQNELNERDEEHAILVERCFSPETELYMDKLNVFSKDLDDLLEKTGNRTASNDISNGFCESPNPFLVSDVQGTASSDREDSGIHTTDVSCSVSQADESAYEVEDSDLLSPNPSQKFVVETELQKLNNENEQKSENTEQNEMKNDMTVADSETERTNNKKLIPETKCFLEQLQKQAAIDLELERKWKLTPKVVARPPATEAVTNLKKIEKDTHPNTNRNTPLILDYIDELELSNSPLAPPKAVEPPKEKPPPPPPLDQDDYQEKTKAFNTTKRIKKEIYVKRSSFLGLDEPTDDQIDPDISIERPPDINRFLQEESQMEKCLYRKLHGSREMISEVESQDSGLESERGRLSSDTWCSNGTSAHFRQDSEQTNSVTSEEDEVTRKEREIIELVEKEEKSKTAGTILDKGDLESIHYGNCSRRNFPLCSEYYPVDSGSSTTYCNSTLSDTDLEVMRVEQELNQLERKHVESQKYMLSPCDSPSRNIRRKSQCQNSLENICDTDNCSPYRTTENYRKSLPDLYHDYKPSSSNCSYRKSMPDINQTPYLSFKKHENVPMYALEYRKSMPELEGIYPRPPIIPHLKEAYPSNWENKQAYMECVEPPIIGGKMKPKQPVSRHEVHALSAVPKQKHIPNDIWIQPKVNTETKNYNQHWLLQEAELRRIEEHQKNRGHQGHLKWQLPARPEQQHIPDPIIETLTHRIQNRTGENHRRQFLRRPQPALGNKDCNRFVYVTHDHNLNHGVSKSYSSPLHLQESQNQLLSVSGKKKCSYCGIELGRGAAMIIESLALFYHMECFKCCVCHVQLGDGLMGTDVRVRNQKLHCHNCYSSDDGVKFSCV